MPQLGSCHSAALTERKTYYSFPAIHHSLPSEAPEASMHLATKGVFSTRGSNAGHIVACSMPRSPPERGPPTLSLFLLRKRERSFVGILCCSRDQTSGRPKGLWEREIPVRGAEGRWKLWGGGILIGFICSSSMALAGWVPPSARCRITGLEGISRVISSNPPTRCI